MINKCQWCKTSYPAYDQTERFYSVNVFEKKRVICGSCKKRLKLIKRAVLTGKSEEKKHE